MLDTQLELIVRRQRGQSVREVGAGQPAQGTQLLLGTFAARQVSGAAAAAARDHARGDGLDFGVEGL